MIYFATENDIKLKTNIHRNVDYADIAPNIRVAAITYIRPILGKRFFDDILNKYNTNSLSNKEEELVEIIKLVVIYRGADLTLPFLSFAVKNKGIQTQSGEFSSAVGLDVLNYIRNEVKKMAHINENELKEYLKLNKQFFPLYTAKENEEIIKPSSPETSTGFDII